MTDGTKRENRRSRGLPGDGVELSGFTFLIQPQELDTADRVGFIEAAQQEGDHRWQPYAAAADELRRKGDTKAANELEIEWRKRDIRNKRPKHEKWYVFHGYWLSRAWQAVLRWTIGYGYRPARVVLWALGIIAIFAVMVGLGNQPDSIAPTHSPSGDPICTEQQSNQQAGPSAPVTCAYPTMYPIAYAADAFLPVVNLGQTDNWAPAGGNGYGVVLAAVQWIVILSGWVLTAIFVAGLTNVVKRPD